MRPSHHQARKLERCWEGEDTQVTGSRSLPEVPQECALSSADADAQRPKLRALLFPLSPQLLPGDVLALLETWMPLSPLEWPPA